MSKNNISREPTGVAHWQRAGAKNRKGLLGVLTACISVNNNLYNRNMTRLVKYAPPLIPQQLRGIIEAKRSQSLYNEPCDRSALMMPRTCCGIKGGARFTNCVIPTTRKSCARIIQTNLEGTYMTSPARKNAFANSNVHRIG